MNTTQDEKALRFRELHQRPGVLLIPNPWDNYLEQMVTSAELSPFLEQ